MDAPTRVVEVGEVSDLAPPGWDGRVVGVPGGHVMQSSVWAEHRRAQGVAPRFVTFADGQGALLTLRRSPLRGGVSVACRRGPAPGHDDPARFAARCVALARLSRSLGARDLFLDPVHDADAELEAALAAAGFVVAEELEPSIHVMRLDLPAGGGPEALRSGFSRSTRQRIARAERAGVTVSRDDGAEHLEEFGELLLERAEVLGIPLSEGGAYLRAWRAEIAAGLARLLVAHHAGELVGGLLLYVQGGIHATAYSADRASRRRDLPGIMHLLRWTVIHDALAEGLPAIELGGVDLPGHRDPPSPGDPTWGLYEHKASFGARWVARTPAHRIVLRPWLERYAGIRRAGMGLLARAWRRPGRGRS